ncbi:hypothetical protein MAPG_09286, partial [Magnaporthiopsis poae ATCC 64411]
RVHDAALAVDGVGDTPPRRHLLLGPEAGEVLVAHVPRRNDDALGDEERPWHGGALLVSSSTRYRVMGARARRWASRDLPSFRGVKSLDDMAAVYGDE